MGKIVEIKVTMAAGIWGTKLGEKGIMEKWSDIWCNFPLKSEPIPNLCMKGWKIKKLGGKCLVKAETLKSA